MYELHDRVADVNGIFAKIYEELKVVPITFMFMIGIYGAVATLWFDHVSKDDFKELKAQMINVKFTLERDHADSELHKIETELFQLDQHVKSVPNADELYYRRIDELKNRHDELQREIARLDRTTQ